MYGNFLNSVICRVNVYKKKHYNFININWILVYMHDINVVFLCTMKTIFDIENK
jgi:hypothetical protein